MSFTELFIRVPEITWTSNDLSTQLHIIGKTLRDSDHSVHDQGYTDLKFKGPMQLI